MELSRLPGAVLGFELVANRHRPRLGGRGGEGADVASYAHVAAECEGCVGMAQEHARSGWIKADIEERPAGSYVAEVSPSGLEERKICRAKKLCTSRSKIVKDQLR